MTIGQIIKISPRFAVMLGSMILSIVFIVLDILSVTSVLKNSLPIGINPFWKLSFVFKCLTDAVVLDDFKTALDRLRAFKISRLGSFAVDGNDSRTRRHQAEVANANNWMERIGSHQDASMMPNQPLPSPDGDYIHPRWEELKVHRRDSHPNSHHLEYDTGPLDERARAASRDRDSEENRVESIEPLPQAHQADLEAQRGSSDAHILKDQDDWPLGPGSSSEKDIDQDYDEDPLGDNANLEYAEAVRSMTHESTNRPHFTGSLRQNPLQKRFGG